VSQRESEARADAKVARKREQAAEEANEFRNDIKRIARDVLNHKGIKRPTETQLAKAMRHPKIVAEGIRQGREKEDLEVGWIEFDDGRRFKL
jgi:hypothetical protein